MLASGKVENEIACGGINRPQKLTPFVKSQYSTFFSLDNTQINCKVIKASTDANPAEYATVLIENYKQIPASTSFSFFIGRVANPVQ